MNKIIPPILFGEAKPSVADLQTALIKLGFDGINEHETSQNYFGESTCQAVKTFKEKFRLKTWPCLVESKTAEAINARLRRAGQQINILPPLYFGMQSEAVSQLQSALGQIGFGANIDPAEKGRFGETTCHAVVNFQREMRIQIDPCYIDEDTANKINALIEQNPDRPGEKYSVSGFVFDTTNNKVSRQPVMAYDIDLLGSAVYKKATTIAELTAKGGVQHLGDAISNTDGYYNIEFTLEDFKADEAPSGSQPDVLVVAVDGDRILGRSILSKQKDFTDNQLTGWNVIASQRPERRGDSEYQLVSSSVLSFLNSQPVHLQPWQLRSSSDMIEFLADELSVSIEKLNAFVFAHFFMNDAVGQRERANEIINNGNAIEFLYGLLKPTRITTWQGVARTTVKQISQAILKSSAENTISIFSEQQIEAFALAIHSFAIFNSIQQNENLGNILKIGIPDLSAAEKFHTLYTNHEDSLTRFWEAISNDDLFKGHVETLKLSNQLSALTLNNGPLMTNLAAKAKDNDITSLLELSDADWDAAIGDHTPTPMPDGKEGYRNFLKSQLYAAFYNEKVSLMVKNENEIKIPDGIVRDKLHQFLATTKFDLRNNRLADKVNNKTFQEQLEEISQDKKEEVEDELKKIQRVFQISPSPEMLTKLLESGIDSATMVSSMPFTTFKEKYKDLADEPVLLSIHQRACHIVSMLEFSILSLNSFSQSASVPAIAGNELQTN